MTISRREFLQAAAAAGFVMAVDLSPVGAKELPAAQSWNTHGGFSYVKLPDGGIDFDGLLGGVYVMPTQPQLNYCAEVTITRPDGAIVIQSAFAQVGGWYWLADLGMHIVGPVNVACSVDADILLAAMP